MLFAGHIDLLPSPPLKTALCLLINGFRFCFSFAFTIYPFTVACVLRVKLFSFYPQSSIDFLLYLSFTSVIYFFSTYLFTDSHSLIAVFKSCLFFSSRLCIDLICLFQNRLILLLYTIHCLWIYTYWVDFFFSSLFVFCITPFQLKSFIYLCPFLFLFGPIPS